MFTGNLLPKKASLSLPHNLDFFFKEGLTKLKQQSKQTKELFKSKSILKGNHREQASECLCYLLKTELRTEA